MLSMNVGQIRGTTDINRFGNIVNVKYGRVRCIVNEGMYVFKHRCLYYQITKKENVYVLVFPLGREHANIQDMFENCTIYKLESGDELQMFDHTGQINRGIEFSAVGFF
ncbi:hypothetical protein [Paenibacillus hamazuiensis]|uniref:hypothetical protein n=1 Tax=Paenibacillus hamazuiensis TaxID=2936508 RepID=UPI00200E3CFD|nr:hypothetical protein [Paenibacillus hamazuiensis]